MNNGQVQLITHYADASVGIPTSFAASGLIVIIPDTKTINYSC